MAEILDTAQGSVPADIEQIKTAVYGREVRASIAEALGLLYAGLTLDDGSTVKDKLAALLEDTSLTKEQLETLLTNIYDIGPYADLREFDEFMSGGSHAPFLFHYNDGTTSKEAYEAGQTYVDWRGRRYSIGENGVLTPYKAVPNENDYFDRLNCGYKEYTSTASDGSVTKGFNLFDSNARKILAITGGYRRQGCFLYDDNGLVGFVTNLTTGERILLADILTKSDITNVAEVGA